jgi:hypothetical protein
MPLTVRNWSKFQHYKDRRPPWIKLHRTLLDDFDFIHLPFASQALAPRIWLLASESDDGSIPDDPERLSFRLHCDVSVVVDVVNSLIAIGFLDGALSDSGVLAPREQEARLETEAEKRQRERQNGVTAFPLSRGGQR